jgi:AbrB family looped-hinge helix DNA binding protein
MKQLVASITSRGQVTIPVEVQRKLGLKPRGKVVFEIIDGTVRLGRPKFTVATLYGSVEPLTDQYSIEEMIEIAREEHVQNITRKDSLAPK